MLKFSFMIAIYAVAPVSIVGNASAQQVVSFYNFANTTNTSTYTQPILATIGNGSFTSNVTTISRVAGTNTVGPQTQPETTNGTATGTNANGSSASILSGNTGTNYFQFQTVTSGFTNLKIDYAYQRSSSAGTQQTLTYSTDGMTFNGFANNTFSTNSTSFVPVSFDLSSITALNNSASSVFFRITFDAVGAGSGNTGTSRIDNLLISGTPAPPALVSLLFGSCATGLTAWQRRRKRTGQSADGAAGEDMTAAGAAA